MQKTTVGVFFGSNDTFVRNFLDTKAFGQLATEHDLIAVGTPAVLKKVLGSFAVAEKNIFTANQSFVYSGFWMRYERFLSEVITYRYRKRSTSFEYRIFRRRWWSRLSVYSDSILMTQDELCARLPSKVPRRPKLVGRDNDRSLRLAGRPIESFDALAWMRGVRLRQRIREEFYSVMSGGSWFAMLQALGRWNQRSAKRFAMEMSHQGVELVILLSNAYEPHLRPLLRSLRMAKVKTFLAVDNWDNLSSKIALPELPDAMGVWGAQAKRHAVEIHGMSSDRIFEIGSARFIPYADSVQSPVGALSSVKQVLFVGCSNSFLETPILKFLDRSIEHEFPGQLVVKYRPHPHRHQRVGGDVFNAMDYKHVGLERDRHHGLDSAPSEAVYRYVNFDEFCFVVGSPTSLSLEAALNRKTVILLATDDLVHPETASIYLRNSTHFEGFEDLQSVHAARDLNELWSLFSNFVFGSQECDSSYEHDSDEALNWFCRTEFDKFGERLASAVTRTLNRDHGRAR